MVWIEETLSPKVQSSRTKLHEFAKLRYWDTKLRSYYDKLLLNNTLFQCDSKRESVVESRSATPTHLKDGFCDDESRKNKIRPQKQLSILDIVVRAQTSRWPSVISEI